MTDEHRTKRSDLKAVFGEPTQQDPLFYHDAEKRNVRVGSLKNKNLTWQDHLCPKCNNERTQPDDKAWAQMSERLRGKGHYYEQSLDIQLRQPKGKAIMLYTIAVVLVILWLLGLVTSTTMGGFIHVLLVIAVIVILLRLISGRRPL